MMHTCTPRSTAFAKLRRGFTLLELLVVIGIITILAALLVPVVKGARDQGKAVLCQSHQRQLWQGFLLFAADHDQHLPGGWSDVTPKLDPNPDHWDWLLGRYTDYLHGPQSGTIFKYVNKDYSIYRCPSLQTMAPRRNDAGFGADSNGRFDYAVFLCFAGARLDRLPANAYAPKSQELVPTPIICEEGSYQINGHNTEGGHANVDQMSHNHHGGSYYMAPDGACHWYNEPYVNPTTYAANDWHARAPSGSLVSLGAGLKWGQWGAK